MERRERWQPLNGKWLFSFDKPIYDREIEVPFAYQTEASGVNEKEHHETVWYKRDVILNDEMKSSEHVVVRFLGGSITKPRYSSTVDSRVFMAGQGTRLFPLI